MHHRLRLIAFGLLLALGFGVVTAAHPCAAAVSRKSSAAASVKPFACHHGTMHHRPASGNPAKHRGCCDPTPGDPTICRKACQAIAVLVRPATLFAVESRTELTSPTAERPLSLFVASIDHIPLA